MKFDSEKIEKYISQGLLYRQWHSNGKLQILNYSQLVQYSKAWDEITRECRGLILNKNYEVVARAFPKFFNAEEIDPSLIPNEPFIAMEKMDGSLGILYWIDDIPHISTRGSFTSDQAIKATEMLHTKYKHTWDKLREMTYAGVTFLFEIIYPENRIVVDYEGREELVLLAIRENVDAKDIDGNPISPYFNFIWHQDLGFPVVKKYDGINDFNKLKELNEDNKEGFVIRFKSGFMLKIKFSEYVRLHRILTQTSSKIIWEFLKDGKPLDEILKNIPDEFFDWVHQTMERLEKQYDEIELNAKRYFVNIIHELCREYKIEPLPIFHNWTDYHNCIATISYNEFPEKFQKKDYALKVMGNPDYKKVAGILFNMVIQKPYKDIIWKMIKPEYERPFKSAGQIEG